MLVTLVLWISRTLIQWKTPKVQHFIHMCPKAVHANMWSLQLQ
jgi:hypothetical protein